MSSFFTKSIGRISSDYRLYMGCIIADRRLVYGQISVIPSASGTISGAIKVATKEIAACSIAHTCFYFVL